MSTHIHTYYKLVVIFIHLYMEKYKFVSSYAVCMCDSEGNCVILYIIIKYLRYIGIHVCCLDSYENATTHLDCVRATAAIFCTQSKWIYFVYSSLLMYTQTLDRILQFSKIKQAISKTTFKWTGHHTPRCTRIHYCRPRKQWP